MNVVVSAIVDPWVTTLSFVVALAMRIQVRKNTSMSHILLTIDRICDIAVVKEQSREIILTEYVTLLW